MAYTTPVKVFNEMQRLEEAEEGFSNVSTGDTIQLSNHYIVENGFDNQDKTAIVTVDGNIQNQSDYTVNLDDNSVNYNGTDTGEAKVRYYFAPFNSTTVSNIIDRVREDIDDYTNTTFDGLETVTDEIYDGVEEVNPTYVLANRPVENVNKVEVNEPKDNTNPRYVEVTEGLGEDYLEYKGLGFRFLREGTTPSNKPEEVRVSYDYGYSDVPPGIEELATLMTVDRLTKGTVSGAMVDGRDNFDPQTVNVQGGRISELRERWRIQRMENMVNLAVKGN